MPFDATDYVPATVDPRTLETPRERLIYLRDFIAKLPPERFDMQNWGDINGTALMRVEQMADCGTRACICGWVNTIFAPPGTFLGDTYGAGEVIGLKDGQRSQLFEPTTPEFDDVADYDGPTFISATPAQAAAVLTHLIETGEVDWSVA